MTTTDTIDAQVTALANAATTGWKRLGDFCDPIYVRNIHGTCWVITDLRAYADGDRDFWPWSLQTLASWVDPYSDEEPETWRTLADAKASAALMAAERDAA